MYSFEKINEDTYKLKTNKNEFTFTRTVDLAKELQKIDMYTTMYMADLLQERGETFENTKLKVEKVVDGKIVIDETNFNELRNHCRDIAYYDVLDAVFKKTLGIRYKDICEEIEVSPFDDKRLLEFINDFTKVIVDGIDNTPRSENT